MKNAVGICTRYAISGANYKRRRDYGKWRCRWYLRDGQRYARAADTAWAGVGTRIRVGSANVLDAVVGYDRGEQFAGLHREQRDPDRQKDLCHFDYHTTAVTAQILGLRLPFETPAALG